MLTLIADTFQDSLTRLTGDEQKAVKTTVFDLQANPVNSGLSIHRIDNAKDKNFWSVRVNRDLRIVIHRTGGNQLLCYVGHHDDAYAWAERRKLETHPTTGAAQMVVIRESIKEIIVPKYVETPIPAAVTPQKQAPLFAHLNELELLGYGIPPEWIDDVRGTDSEDALLALTDHLPAEAAEALIELATGGTPRITPPAPDTTNPFDHPDALRRFRVMANVEEMQRALEFPWDKWTIFLHPEQHQWVERDYSGPARVSGTAGTGKTIVALHRAVYLARKNPEARVLLATFSEPLAAALHVKLRRLLSSEPLLGERIDVHAMTALGLRLHRARLGSVTLASQDEIIQCLRDASQAVPGHKFALSFLCNEWDHLVDARQLRTWEAYRDAPRLGRKTRLSEAQRATLWSIFAQVWATLEKHSHSTEATVFAELAKELARSNWKPFDFAVIDEAQDLSVTQLQFLATLGNKRPNSLFFAGDLGQRIFRQPYSWQSLGVDIRGRSRALRINYRTSHQIRRQADRLLDQEITDADGNQEKRDDTVSVFNGPPPEVRVLDNIDDEIKAVATWLADLLQKNMAVREIGIFVRSESELPRARAAVEKAGLPLQIFDERMEVGGIAVAIGTMHGAKGLEFRAVAVMACDDEIIPLQSRIEAVGETGDLEEIYETERHLLYVACTRARDYLLITATKPASEFLDDLRD